MYRLTPLNMIRSGEDGDEIEIVSPDIVAKKMPRGTWFLIDGDGGTVRTWTCAGHNCVLYTSERLEEGALLRIKDENYKTGEIRDAGR